MKPTAASSKRGVAGQVLRNMGVRAEECTLRCLQLKRRSTSGAGARHLEATSTPKVEESGACLARRPRRTKMVTERYASMGCRRLAHTRTLEYVYIYVCTYISISRAETVELRTWISQRSQRQLRPNGMLPDKYLETQTGSPTHLPTMTVKRIVRRLVRCNSDRKFRLRAALAWSRITLLLSAQARPPQTFTYVRGNTHSHIHTHMHTYMHTSIHACVHTCVHTCMPQSNIDMTHVHTHVHSRTCARMWAYKSNAALLLSNPCQRAAQWGTCASSWLDE